MNHVLADKIATEEVKVYIDDILIHSLNLEKHREMVQCILEKLKKHNICTRPHKCEFECDQVTFLGMVIRKGKVEHLPKQCKALKEWPKPSNVTETQCFLGLINYYQQFIPHLASCVAALYAITGKDKWRWENEPEDAFLDLRQLLVNAPSLFMLKDHGKYQCQ